MTIEPQKSGESLKDRVSEDSDEESLDSLADDIIDSLPVEETEGVEEDKAVDQEEEEPTTIHRKRINQPMSSNKVTGGTDTVESSDVPVFGDPVEGPLGPADYESTTHVAPQILEEAHKFLNQYGIKTDDLTPKEVMEKIEKIHSAKEEAGQVLARGQALDSIDRLLSFVPEGYVGGFFRENDMDINRAKALKYVVFESEEANLASSTGKADGLVRCADQILMIIPEEEYIANRLIKAERLAERRKGRDHKLGRVDQGSGEEGSHPLFPLIKL